MSSIPQEVQQVFSRLHGRAATEAELSALAEFWDRILSEEEACPPSVVLAFDGGTLRRILAELTP